MVTQEACEFSPTSFEVLDKNIGPTDKLNRVLSQKHQS